MSVGEPEEGMDRLSDEESDRLYMSAPNAKSVGAFIEALTILARYMEGGVEKTHFSAAEHDVFYAGGDGPEKRTARTGDG